MFKLFFNSNQQGFRVSLKLSLGLGAGLAAHDAPEGRALLHEATLFCEIVSI